MKKPPRDVDFEVLPPERDDPDPVMRIAAFLLDNAFRLPGTNRRFGLDPILGLLPGVGDGVTGLISALLIVNCARRGVPKIVVARMALNVVINSLAGVVPVAGDAFSFWFKSNARNYALLQKHIRRDHLSTKGDWAFVIAMVGGVLLFVFGLIFAVAWLIAKAVTLAGG